MIQSIGHYLDEIEQQFQMRAQEINNEIQKEEKEASKTIFEQIIEIRGEPGIHTVTRFSLNEFREIFEICRPHLHRSGKGRQFKLNPVDMSLVTITFLTTGCKYNTLSQMFLLDDSLVHRTIQFTVKHIAKPLVDRFCQQPILLDPNEKHFQNFPNAIGAIDTTFILIEKPIDKEEQKRNWSYKHGTCGVKIQCLVRPSGLCSKFVANVPGSIHDITIFKQSGWLEKFAFPMQMENGTTIIKHLQALFDKGYTGLNNQGYPEAIEQSKSQ